MLPSRAVGKGTKAPGVRLVFLSAGVVTAGMTTAFRGFTATPDVGAVDLCGLAILLYIIVIVELGSNLSLSQVYNDIVIYDHCRL